MRHWRYVAALTMFSAALVVAGPAAAQGSDPNPGGITFTGGMDWVNAYHFRGIPQDEGTFGTIMWPYADLGLALYSGDGGLKSLAVSVQGSSISFTFSLNEIGRKGALANAAVLFAAETRVGAEATGSAGLLDQMPNGGGTIKYPP